MNYAGTHDSLAYLARSWRISQGLVCRTCRFSKLMTHVSVFPYACNLLQRAIFVIPGWQGTSAPPSSQNVRSFAQYVSKHLPPNPDCFETSPARGRIFGAHRRRGAQEFQRRRHCCSTKSSTVCKMTFPCPFACTLRHSSPQQTTSKRHVSFVFPDQNQHGGGFESASMR